MQALIIIDAQNEFSKDGKRPVPDHLFAIAAIAKHVKEARKEKRPIAWIRHYNRPTESPAFAPGTWGAEFTTGFGPDIDNPLEMEFHKNVYGAFTGTDLGAWLNIHDVTKILLAGFYTHGCLSTTAREAIMADIEVVIDADATATCHLKHEVLGELSAQEGHRAALMQLANMGAVLVFSRSLQKQ